MWAEICHDDHDEEDNRAEAFRNHPGQGGVGPASPHFKEAVEKCHATRA